MDHKIYEQQKKQNMLNLLYSKTKPFLLLLIFTALLSVKAIAGNKQEPDSVLTELMQHKKD